MGTKRKFYKFILLPCVCCIPLVGCLTFTGYMAWKEYRINSILIEESLQGNRYAVAILAKYEKPWKFDERILRGAMQGNAYALEVLKVAHESKTQ